MKEATISILGSIGTFVLNGLQYNGIQLKDVVTNCALIPEGTELLNIDIEGPGGSKETGDLIYNFLESLKSKYKINTNQVGDIVSIHTKIFLVGDTRCGLVGINPETNLPYQFLFHPPFNTGASGTADELLAISERTRAHQDELMNLYIDKTGQTVDAILPLMKMETSLDAEETLAMGFSTTTRTALNTAAYMETKKKTAMETYDSLLLAMKSLFKSEGKVVSVAPPAELVGKAMLVDGKSPVDGVYSVVGGMVSAVEAIEEEMAEDAAAKAAVIPAATPVVSYADPIVAAKIKFVDEFMANQAKEKSEADTKLLVETKVAEAIVAFKATLVSGHRPPHKDVIINYETIKESPIARKNRLAAEEKAK